MMIFIILLAFTLLIYLIYKNYTFLKNFIKNNKILTSFFIATFVITFILLLLLNFDKNSKINLKNNNNNNFNNNNNIELTDNNSKIINLNNEEKLQNQIIDEIEQAKNNLKSDVDRYEGGDYIEYHINTLKKFNYLTKEDVEKIFLKLGINKDNEKAVQSNVTKCEVLDAYLNSKLTREYLTEQNKESLEIAIDNNNFIANFASDNLQNYYLEKQKEQELVPIIIDDYENASQIILFICLCQFKLNQKFQDRVIKFIQDKQLELPINFEKLKDEYNKEKK